MEMSNFLPVLGRFSTEIVLFSFIIIQGIVILKTLERLNRTVDQCLCAITVFIGSSLESSPVIIIVTN